MGYLDGVPNLRNSAEVVTAYNVSFEGSALHKRNNRPLGGSALQGALHAPHNPSRPSPTGDLTGEALAHSHGLEGRVRMSPRKMRRERRLPPGGLTIDGAADISARISRPMIVAW